MDGLVIRRFGEGDSVEALTDLLHRAYAELGAMGLNFTAVDQAPEVTRGRMRGKECWLAVLDGRVAGTVLLAPSAPEECPALRAGPPVAYLSQLAVDPALRRRGIGSRLLGHAEERAAALGFRTVALDTADGAAHLLRIYAARGYRELFRHRNPAKTYTHVVLAKGLARPGA